VLGDLRLVVGGSGLLFGVEVVGGVYIALIPVLVST
jgi:hypothetical protein